MNDKILWMEGALYTLIAVFTPVAAVLSSESPLTARVLCALGATSIISGATALKAFLSTSFSRATGDAVLVRDPASESSWAGLTEKKKA